MMERDVSGRTMTHVLILNEGEESGQPVWRFANSREEATYVHAQRLQDDWDAGLSPNERLECVWARAFWKTWAAVDLGYYDDQQYALYLPCSQRDFVLVCSGSGTYGNGFEVITPAELREEHAKTFSRIWRQTRPLRYLRQSGICRELAVPWAYLLGLYYESSISLFISESEAVVETVRELSQGVHECSEVSYREMLWLEKWQWRNLYQQREEKLAVTEEQKAQHREWLERFGP